MNKKWRSAIEVFKPGADEGRVGSQIMLAMCYEIGWGVTRDFKAAVYWYGRAADQGNPYGMERIGYCHEKGRGVERSLVKAAECYQRSVDQGSPVSPLLLAWLYLQNKAPGPEYSKARHCLVQGARLEDFQALQSLGRFEFQTQSDDPEAKPIPSNGVKLNWLVVHPREYDRPPFHLPTLCGLTPEQFKAVLWRRVPIALKSFRLQGRRRTPGELLPVTMPMTPKLADSESLGLGAVGLRALALLRHPKKEVDSRFLSTLRISPFKPDPASLPDDRLPPFGRALPFAIETLQRRNNRLKGVRVRLVQNDLLVEAAQLLQKSVESVIYGGLGAQALLKADAGVRPDLTLSRDAIERIIPKEDLAAMHAYDHMTQRTIFLNLDVKLSQASKKE